jgi:hypothetical protein
MASGSFRALGGLADPSRLKRRLQAESLPYLGFVLRCD